MTTRAYEIGDRVDVPPRTQVLGHEAPGGPGTVVEVKDTSRGPIVTVALDAGGIRDPFADFVTPIEDGAE